MVTCKVQVNHDSQLAARGLVPLLRHRVDAERFAVVPERVKLAPHNDLPVARVDPVAGSQRQLTLLLHCFGHDGGGLYWGHWGFVQKHGSSPKTEWVAGLSPTTRPAAREKEDVQSQEYHLVDFAAVLLQLATAPGGRPRLIVCDTGERVSISLSGSGTRSQSCAAFRSLRCCLSP